MGRWQHQREGRNMDHLTVSGFHRRIPFLVAEHEGFFAAEDLDVAFHTVTYAPDHNKEMARGQWDFTLSSADNMITRTTTEGIDYVLFMQAEQGLGATLVGRAGIGRPEDLRGALIASDNGTNLDLIRAKILRGHGLEPADYRVESIGSSPRRLEAFLAGRVDALMLTEPWTRRAIEAGATPLAVASAYVPRWPLVCGWGLRSWAEANRARLVRFIRAFVRATDWALDPANREAALALLMEVQGVARDRAEEAYTRIVPKACVDPAAIGAVIDLRIEMGVYPPQHDPPERFFDTEFWCEATGLPPPAR